MVQLIKVHIFQNVGRFSKLRIISRNNSAQNANLAQYETRCFRFPCEIKKIKIVDQNGAYPKVFSISGDNIEQEITDFKDVLTETGPNTNPQSLGRQIGLTALQAGTKILITSAIPFIFSLI